MSLYVGDRVVCSSTYTCIPHGHLHTATYTRGRIYTIASPDDEHLVARNMYRIGINKHKKKNMAPSWLFTKTVQDARSTEHRIHHACCLLPSLPRLKIPPNHYVGVLVQIIPGVDIADKDKSYAPAWNRITSHRTCCT